MDIRKIMKGEATMEEFSSQLLDLDSEFRFKCRKCGKCCKHQNTILFTARDVFNIAKKLDLSTEDVINQYAETYIGSASRIPVVHMVPRGPSEACPFLTDGRCSIHECKPVVCALYPLGRVIVNAESVTKGLTPDGELTVKYMLNNTDCGSQKRTNTVRNWLARFGIPEHDKFFLLWSDVVVELTATVHAMETCNVSQEVFEFVWNAIFNKLYLSYDVAHEFMPQFEHNAAALYNMCHELQQAVEKLQNDQCDD